MTRTGVPSEFATGSFTAFLAVELEFDSGTLRIWNGYGEQVASLYTELQKKEKIFF